MARLTRSRWISSNRFSASVFLLPPPPPPEPEPEAELEPVASSLGLDDDLDFFFLREEASRQGSDQLKLLLAGQRAKGEGNNCTF